MGAAKSSLLNPFIASKTRQGACQSQGESPSPAKKTRQAAESPPHPPPVDGNSTNKSGTRFVRRSEPLIQEVDPSEQRRFASNGKPISNQKESNGRDDVDLLKLTSHKPLYKDSDGTLYGFLCSSGNAAVGFRKYRLRIELEA